MIVCRHCGKKKKVQRLPKHHATWECSTCKGTRVAKVVLGCFHCQKTVSLRASQVQHSDYFLCGHCVNLYGTKPIDGFRQPGQLMVHKLHAAGELNGYDIRYPTPDEAASVDRAKLIRDIGIAQLQRERALTQGVPLQPQRG
jgi:hypothetical protein